MAPRPMRRAAETDTAAEALEQNAWSPARAEELTGTAAPPHTTPHLTPSSRPMVPCDRRRRHLQRRPPPRPPGGGRQSHPEGAAETSALCTEERVGRGLPSAQTEVDPTQPQQPLAWRRRAPRDRAPSGSAGKRRTPGSWIRLQSSSEEETKRRGARVRSGVTWPLHPSNPPLAAGPMKTLWFTSSGALCPLLVLNPGGETPWVWPRPRVPRAQSRRSGDAETKAHCPRSSTWEKPSPVHPQNAGAPSSKPSAEDKAADPAGRGEGGEQAADSQPPETLTH